MLALNGITKIYDKDYSKTKVLDNVSLKIKKGELTALMGVSGSGKTTLLNILGGMDRATEGTYDFMDIQVDMLSQSQLNKFRKENVSFVFQNFALMNHFSVFENVELPLLMKNVPRRKRKIKVCAILEQMGILEMKDKLPIHLSGGQKQRCAIARALVSESPLILADEPTGALDRKTSAAIMELFKEMNAAGRTVIIVTHDRNVAEACNRILYISDGKVYEEK